MEEYRNSHDRFVAGAFYHIYNRSINRETIFLLPENYSFFLGRCRKYLTEHLDIWAYCILPTHFHLLVKVKDCNKEVDLNTVLEKKFKCLLSSYALAFNKHNQRSGSLFQKSFKEN